MVYPYRDEVYYDLPHKKGCELLSAEAYAEYSVELGQN